MAEPPNAELVGTRLGDFEVLRLLGEGGMGSVYEARQVSLDRRVALKTLRREWTADPSYLERFRAEALAAAPIHHPNIVSVIAIGAERGVHFIAMEFVDGRNLREHLKRTGGLEEREALTILKKLVAALERAHEAGVVHRDVKPENILLTRKVGHRPSEVKVADFGLARRLDPQALHLTQSGMTMGTPLYMSPEQSRGLPADARSDLYSVGVTAYCMLAGEPPYRGDTPVAVAIQHLQGNARPIGELRPDIAPEFAALVHRMMAVEPAARPASAAELLAELNALKPGGGSAAPPTAATAALHPVARSGPAPTLPAMSAPSTSGTQRIAESLQRFAAAADERHRRAWTLPAAAVAMAGLGAAAAWPLREPDPFRGAAAESLLPTLDSLPEPELAVPDDVLAEARKAAGPERERQLWLIVKTFPNDGEALDAALDLLRGYFQAGDFARARELGQALNPKGEQHPMEYRLLGLFCRKLADIRAGRLKGAEAEKALKDILKPPKDPPAADDPLLAGTPARLKALAAEYFAVLPRIAGDDPKRRQELAEAFWERFRSKPKPPAAK